MTALALRRVHPEDDDAVRGWFDVKVAAAQADCPGDPGLSWAVHRGMLRHPWPDSDVRVWLALADGRPAGCLAFHLSTRENLDTAAMELEVHPDHRRRGYGRILLDEAVRQAKEAGRSRLVSGAVSGGPGAAFATAAGARAALVDTQRMLDLTRLDHAHLDALLADARSHAAGYSLVRWSGVTPEPHLDAIAALESRMTTDAPFDDLAWEQEVFDAERIRRSDQVRVARGMRSYTTAAVHDSSGASVGYTRLVVFGEVRDAAAQWQTIVLPEHRGHRLGMLLKIANLRFLQEHEPAVRRVDTWNADSNAPMLRVNLALGFEVVRQWAEWELAL